MESSVMVQVITLCGSTRFKEAFFIEARRLTLEGHIVLTTFIFTHDGDEITKKQKKMLKTLQEERILISNRAHVININNYIGESTRSEINYAKKHGREVTYLEKKCIKN